jgi:hypothetical protein
MNKQSIILNALKILKSDLMEEGEMTVSIIILGFLNSHSKEYMSGEFSGIVADSYNEGFYYQSVSGRYYYNGEAIADNPGSFSNTFAFELNDQDLALLPEGLKDVLKRVGTTKMAEVMVLKDLRLT